MNRAARMLLPLLLGASAAAASQPLPRLFFSPQERSQIEAQRRGEAVGAPAQARADLQVQGAIRARHRGVGGWIDGRRVAEGERIGGFVAQFKDGAVRLRSEGGSVVDVPVGARVDAQARRVTGLPAVLRSSRAER